MRAVTGGSSREATIKSAALKEAGYTPLETTRGTAAAVALDIFEGFPYGIVVVTREGEGIILYHDGRVWEYRSR